MKLFPYHDANGRLYPELDTREVSISVVCQYLGISRFTAWERARRNEYGSTTAEGAWFIKARTGSGGQYAFRPSILWRRKCWGRFAVIGFDPMQVETRVRIFCCDPAKTAEQQAPQQGAGFEAFAEHLTHVSASLMESMAVIRRLMPPNANQQTLTFNPLERQK